MIHLYKDDVADNMNLGPEWKIECDELKKMEDISQNNTAEDLLEFD